MALRTPPSWQQNSSHPAENDRLSMTGLFRTSGVLLASDLAVTQSVVPALSVSVAAGWGVILGTTQTNMGSYQFTNDLAATATITTADVTNPRIDLICVTVRDAYYPATGVNNDVIINVVPGTPAASPAVPATPANSLVLAQVAVAANATAITNANITDLRQVVTVVNVAQSVAGKNALINGGMEIDQRNGGAAQTLTAGTPAYTIDRWVGYCTGANVTGQRIAGSGTSKYRYQYTGAASVTAIQHYQRIESSNAIPLVGNNATIGVDLSNSLLTSVVWIAYYANGVDNFSGSTQFATGTFTVTSAIARYSANLGVVPTNAANGIILVFTVAAQTSGTWVIGNLQLELGSTATAFSRSGGSIGGELGLCQRYYQKSYPQGTAVPTNGITAGAVLSPYNSGTIAIGATYAQVILPVIMRNTPTMTIYSYTSSVTGMVSTAGGSDLAASSGGTILVGDSKFSLQNASAGALTPFAGGFIFHYAANAEL